MIRLLIISLCTAASLAACQTTADTLDQDALISNPGPESLAEISGVVSKALGGRKTLLANDVLTVNSDLIIDPKYVDGRSLQRPDHFQLKMRGTVCSLLHVETGRTYPLSQTRCAAA